MDAVTSINPTEKQRLRESIAEQVKAYIKRGGSIDVVTDSAPPETGYRGYIWHSSNNPMQFD